MRITSIQLRPVTQRGGAPSVQALADVVFENCLLLRGLKLVRGRYGLFLSFPESQSGSPYKAFDSLNVGFRKSLEKQLLQAYSRLPVHVNGH